MDIPGNYDPEMRNRLGAQSGLIAHSVDGVLDDTDLFAARYLGQRVMQVSKKFAACGLFNWVLGSPLPFTS
ncbi:hypothetical protein GCM10009022_32500 [Vreelandella titanicae]